jgi:molecular chaperone IbpA
MRNLDFAPLYRATVGFDRIADLMDRVLTADVPQPTYPPITSRKRMRAPIASRLPLPGFRPTSLVLR